MRKYEISPAIIAEMRKRIAAQSREVGVPLYLPAYDADGGLLPARAFVEFDAEDLRVEADGVTIGPDEDDDFY